MHILPASDVTKFPGFPRPEIVQPRRETRRAPPVAEADVPEDLLSVPGSPRDRAQEVFFARHYREPNFKTGKLNLTYHKVVEAKPGYVNETYRTLVEKYGDLIPRVNAAAFSYHEREAAPERDQAADLGAEIRAKAAELGVDLVGFTRFDRTYVTRETKDAALFKNAIVLCRAFDWDTTHRAPSVEWDVHSYDTSLALALGALHLADFIRSKGYRVQFIAGTGLPGEKMIAPILPYAVAAGLGQIGANGTMLTAEFGSRLRVMGLSTDAPFVHGKPRDFGVNVLCEKCQVCVNRCPGRALSRIKVQWHGVTKYKIVADRCLPVLRFAECNICTKVCPVQHFGLKPVLEHYAATGEVLGKGTAALETYSLFDKGEFGPGELPRLARDEGGQGLMRMAEDLGVA